MRSGPFKQSKASMQNGRPKAPVSLLSTWYRRDGPQLQPLVEPQVSHFRQVPLRTMVKLPHSEQFSPS